MLTNEKFDDRYLMLTHHFCPANCVESVGLCWSQPTRKEDAQLFAVFEEVDEDVDRTIDRGQQVRQVGGVL